MASWNPRLYQKFSDLRNRPCRDLAARIAVAAPHRVVDLGCGPGNLGDIAAQCWPQASLTGIDSSPAMLETARQAHPEYEWRLGDIAEWAGCEERGDIVFSNSALQWVPGHDTLLPKLLGHVNPAGALAVQMPGTYRAAQHQILRDMAASPDWRRWFPEGRAREWHTHDLDFYYETLAPLAARLDLWATEYFQVVPSLESIVEFYKSTGLRPFLGPIEDAAARQRFLAEYLEKLRPVFQASSKGEVFFPMRRIFIIAYR
jgi:trans-aconitate 2-methyltransferase